MPDFYSLGIDADGDVDGEVGGAYPSAELARKHSLPSHVVVVPLPALTTLEASAMRIGRKRLEIDQILGPAMLRTLLDAIDRFTDTG